MIKSRDSSVNVISVFVLSIIFCYHIKSLLIVSNFLKIDKAVVSNWYQNLHDKLSRECVRFKDNIPPTYRLDEDVLKTFSRRLSSSSSKAVLKTTWSRRKYSPQSYAFRRRLQQVLKTSWSRTIYSSWPYVFKTSSRRIQDLLQRYLQDIFKTYHQIKLLMSTCLRDVFNTFLISTAKTIKDLPRSHL